jgi:hypothetical protein
VTLPTTWQRSLDDVGRIKARGDRLAGGAVVQRPAVADLDHPVSGLQCAACAARPHRGVEVEAANGQCW